MPRPVRRILRERRTLDAMIALFCRDNHGCTSGLCQDCSVLLEYASRRLDKCPYQGSKPACSKCPIHCYKPEMRERIRRVMKYSGPRMLLRHPVLALLHLLDTPSGIRKRPDQR